MLLFEPSGETGQQLHDLRGAHQAALLAAGLQAVGCRLAEVPLQGRAERCEHLNDPRGKLRATIFRSSPSAPGTLNNGLPSLT